MSRISAIWAASSASRFVSGLRQVSSAMNRACWSPDTVLGLPCLPCLAHSGKVNMKALGQKGDPCGSTILNED
jgi:hypothetical protein